MQKTRVILLSLLVAACSVLLLPGIAISAGNGGEQLTQNSLQLGVGYDFFKTDLEMTARTGQPSFVSAANAGWNMDFEYATKYIYLKYGLLDWLEIGGRIGLLDMEFATASKISSSFFTAETSGELKWVYWGLHVKARIYESQRGFFTTIALNYERGDSDDITTSLLPTNLVTDMKFDLITVTLIGGWKFQTVTPYAGVGFSDLSMEYNWNPAFSTNGTDKFENENDWTGILGVNIHITEPIVLTIEGALGIDMSSLSAQVGYTFL